MADQPPAPDAAPADTLPKPASAGAVWWVFNRLALQGFGGVLPVAHRELVERERWVSPQQFMELLTLGQVLPGPNIINIAIILGDRFLGWRGAVAAVAGLLGLPLVIVISLALVYQQFANVPWVAGALRGMGAVAAGLVLATAIKLARTLAGNPVGRAAGGLICIGTAVMVGGLRWPMVGVVLGLGALGMGLAWRALAPAGLPGRDAKP